MMTIGKRKTGFRLAEASWDFVIGKVVVTDRVKNRDNKWESVNANIDNEKFLAAFDMPNIERGYVAYIKGEGLNAVLKPLGEDYGDRPPSKQHREGVRLIFKMDKSLGGAVRELISTATTLWDAIDVLHDSYEAGVKEHEGHLPVVGIDSVREGQGSDGPIYIPVFKIIEWVPRPPDLPKGGIPFVWRGKKYDKAANPATATSDNSNGYERPKVADDMNDELPF
jgi:hypothetical protein